MKRTILEYNRTDCLECKYVIENEAMNLSGINSVEVHVSEHKVILDHNESAVDSVNHVKNLIAKIGHKCSIVEDYEI
ncbi:MAG: hypothetical protein JW982_07815 [Spirochaetes bacterium]|nr:hypothetical protein [Spirochaetota bacterium]